MLILETSYTHYKKANKQASPEYYNATPLFCISLLFCP